MQKSGYKLRMAACAALTVILCSVGMRPAHAVLFDFSALCDAICEPTLGPAGSTVTGSLDLAAAAVVPGGIISSADILSFSLNFVTLGPLDFMAPFVAENSNLNAAGDAVERITITDSSGQFFNTDISVEGGAASWLVLTDTGTFGSGTQPTFNIAPPAEVAEPGTMAMFLFAVGSMLTIRRRRRGMVVSK